MGVRWWIREKLRPLLLLCELTSERHSSRVATIIRPWMSMYVTAGTYEGHLVGYRLSPEALEPGATAEQRAAAAPAFALRAHDGIVRGVAGGGALLATCGSDHAISIYNLRKLREQGKLLQQTGGSSLHCLAFFGTTHLVSGGGDGELCIWRSSDWECLLRMKGHKGAVNAVAIHPSGRAALSVAADRKLMLWNLTTGKCNYTTALSEAAHLVAWSPDGESYLHDTRSALMFYSLRSGELLHTLSHEGAPPLCMAFASGALVLSGDAAGTLQVWGMERGKCLLKEAHAHERRVKAIAVLPAPEGTSQAVPALSSAAVICFATASSDSTLTIWRLMAASSKKAPPCLVRLFSIETRSRITALCASAPTGAPAPIQPDADADTTLADSARRNPASSGPHTAPEGSFPDHADEAVHASEGPAADAPKKKKKKRPREPV